MKKILLFIVISFVTLSCNRSFTDEQPPQSIPIELAIRDVSGLEKGVLGIYTGFIGEHTNDIVNFSDLITDNGVLSNANNGQYAEIYGMTYSPLTDKVQRFWNGFNDIIIKSNWVLSYEGKITGSSPEENAKITNLFAEAKLMRAYARLQLLVFFSERYGGDNQQLGIVINNNYNPYDFTTTYPRSTVVESYNAVEKDILFAINNMVVDNSILDRTRMGLLSANLLMSRLQLYKRDWAKTIQYATEAQQLASSAGLVESPSSSPFPNSPNDANQSSIFQIAMDSNNNLGINSLFSYWGSNGSYKQNFATAEFYNIIDAADKRKSIYTLSSSIYDNPQQLYIVKKFGVSFLNDIILMRNAEIDFNLIEATYYQNSTTAKTMLINWMKAYRYPTYNTTATGTDILDEILKQRRIEFAFEGFRFMDLKRNDQSWTKGLNYKGSHTTVLINEKEQCLPIPNQELNVNNKMLQNPGY